MQKNPPSVAPHLRRWFQEQEAERRSGVRRRDLAGDLLRSTWPVWVVIVICGVLALVMDHHHRAETARYRALPSADEQLMSRSLPGDWQEQQAEAIRREYGKISARPRP